MKHYAEHKIPDTKDHIKYDSIICKARTGKSIVKEKQISGFQERWELGATDSRFLFEVTVVQYCNYTIIRLFL